MAIPVKGRSSTAQACSTVNASATANNDITPCCAFLKSLKAMFKHNEIELAVTEAGQGEGDETAYLLRNILSEMHILWRNRNL